MITLEEVVQHNRKWFGGNNQEFFGDRGHAVLHGAKSEKPFLVRSTCAWSDMFGQLKKLHYRINAIDEFLVIGSLIDDVFESMGEVKTWLEEN